MLRISPGKEEAFRYFQLWLPAAAALEGIVEMTEADHDGTESSASTTSDDECRAKRHGHFAGYLLAKAGGSRTDGAGGIRRVSAL